MSPYVEVEGVGRLDEALGMAALDGFGLSPPEPRLRLVEVPGRSGTIDLTEAMGGPFFGDRRQTLRFLVEGDPEAAKSRVLAALHGRRLRYRLSVDPGHTYVGRWSVAATEEHFAGGALVLTCEVVADPYRYRPRRSYLLNPAGGREYWLEGGDKPVRPTLTCRTPTLVEWGGESFGLDPGAYVLRGEPLRRGQNRLYLNSWQEGGTTMGYLAGLTMAELSRHTMAKLRRLAAESGVAARTMGDLLLMTMGELSGMTMRGMRWRPDDGSGAELPVDTTVLVEYEWGDL